MSRKRDDDAAVTQAYLRRIVGYDVTEVKEEYKVNEEGELELLKKTEKTKHVPGDPRAAEFWLANRCPDRWRALRQLVSGQPESVEETGVIEIPEVRPVAAQRPMDRSEGKQRAAQRPEDQPESEGSGSGRAANGSMTDQEGPNGE